MKEIETQTCKDMQVNFIVSFLQLLEEHLASGLISAKDLRNAGAIFDFNNLDDENQRKINELKQLLERLRFKRPYGGDTFFVTLANVFFTKTHVPYDHDPLKLMHKDEDRVNNS